MSFERAFQIVLASEGGYVNHPDDPGGATRWGITEVVARNAGYTGPMEKFPLELAQQIYRESYWNAVRGDELPWPMSLYLFDMAVNSGPAQAIQTLQRTLGVIVDGVLGPRTISAAQAMNKSQQALFMADRAIFYAGLAKFSTFGRGWLKRLFLTMMEAA